MLQAGDRAPDFTLPSLTGESYTLQTPAILVFFKINCPTCQLSMPFLQRMASRGGAPVVAISQNDAESTREFHKAYSIEVPTLLDLASTGYKVSNQYAIAYVPSIFVIDSAGAITFSGHGFSREDLERIGRQWNVAVFDAADRVPALKPG